MTHDEIQRLMGAYATGSLTDSERTLLFDAALEDQELFEQLAHEHALKELIDEPGARDRLIAALAPAHVEGAHVAGGWKRPLAWGLAAAFVLSMSIAAVFVTRSSIRTETARLNDLSSTATSTPASAGTPAPAPVPSRVPAVDEHHEPGGRRSTAAAESRPGKVRAGDNAKAGEKAEAGDKGIVSDKLEPTGRKQEVELASSADASRQKSSSRDSKTGEARPSSIALSSRRPENAVLGGQLLPPPVSPQQFLPSQGAPGQAQQVPPNSPPQNGRALAQAGAAGVGGGGGRGGGIGPRNAVPSAASSRQASKTTTAHFAFDYSIVGEDLVIKFAADGYFSLHIAPGGLTIVDAHVAAGSTRRERIDNNGTEADIVFSAVPQSTSGGLKLTSTLKSDTVEDPGGSRIELLVRLYPPPY